MILIFLLTSYLGGGWGQHVLMFINVHQNGVLWLFLPIPTYYIMVGFTDHYQIYVKWNHFTFKP